MVNEKGPPERKVDSKGNCKGGDRDSKDCSLSRVGDGLPAGGRETYLNYDRRLLSCIPEDLIILDRKCRIVDVNRSVLHITAQRRDELVGNSCFEVGQPWQECLRASFDRAFLDGEPFRTCHDFVLSHGEVRCVEVLLSPLLDDEGRVTHLVEAVWDVTEVYRALESLKTTVARFQAITENTSELTIILDADGVCAYLSPALKSIAEYDPDDVVGKHFADLIHPDDLPLVNETLCQALTDPGRSYGLGHFRLSSRALGWCHLEGLFTAMPDVPGINGVVLSCREVSDRIKAEEAHTRLTTAVEQAGEAITITDAEGRIQYVNPAFESITGYSREEAVGGRPNMLKSGKHDAAFYKSFWGTISKGGVWTGHFVNRKKDGSLYEVDATVSPIRVRGDIVAFVGVSRDVTREREIEAQLLQLQKLDAVGKLAGGVAHDFNNILQAMTGYLEFALNGLDSGGSAYQDLLQVRKGVERAATLTRQLLAFSRRQVLHPEYVDLNEVVSDLLKMLRRIIGEDIQLQFNPERELHSVYADPGQLEQVLLNLCLNSRDAMPEGGEIHIETREVVLDSEYREDHTWAREGTYVALTVRDKGLGMDEETVTKVFEPFFTTKEVGVGTGMGLSTVYGIVKQHDGFIDVASEPGSGTTFNVYFPVVEKPAEAPRPEETVPRGEGTVLLAEDDEMVRKLVVRVLEDAGYTVLAAVDGEHAIARFTRNAEEISLVILDVVMPKMGGQEVYERIREISPTTRVIFTSGYSSATNRTRFLLSEDMKLIQKPYRVEELLSRVREAMRG